MEKNKLLLELNSIYCGYKSGIVLRDVNLKINKDDFIAFIGTNGSGKTTLLKVILGLLKPMQGQINYYFKESVNKSIGYLPQKKIFDERFPIVAEEVIISGLLSEVPLFKRLGRNEREKVNQVMEQMGISDLKGRHIGEMSGGELQRIFLARALISTPELLILDEPNTFVDKNFSDDFFDILKGLNKKMAIILVSHDLGMISSYVKTIACISQTLHYHRSREISEEILKSYECPIDLITHGEIPHRVLDHHRKPENK